MGIVCDVRVVTVLEADYRFWLSGHTGLSRPLILWPICFFVAAMLAERQQRMANITAFVAFFVKLCPTGRAGIELLLTDLGPLPCQDQTPAFGPHRITQRTDTNGFAADGANAPVVCFLVLPQYPVLLIR